MKHSQPDAADETAYLNTIRVLAVAGVVIAHVFIQISSYYSSVLTDVEKAAVLFLRNAVNWNVPLFKVFVRFCGKAALEYALIVLFIFTSALPAFNAITNFATGRGILYHFPVKSVYVFYLLFGYCVHAYGIQLRKTAALLFMHNHFGRISFLFTKHR